MKTVHLNHLKPKEIKVVAETKPLIIIPLGTTEWHADHLPVGVDMLLSQALSDQISMQTGCVVAPPLCTGVTHNLTLAAGYFGSVDTIQNETLTSILLEVAAGYAGLGFKIAIVLTGHFEPDHWSAIDKAIHSVVSIRMVMIGADDILADLVQERDTVQETWPFATDHAAEWETSMMLHFHPELVDMNNAPETIELPMEGIPPYIRTRYPRRASKDYGAQLAEATIAGGVRIIKGLLAEID